MSRLMDCPAVKLLDVVALLHDRPERGLLAGHVGTVVEVLAPDAFEVEFLDQSGRTVAVEGLRREDLLLLRHRVHAAA